MSVHAIDSSLSEYHVSCFCCFVQQTSNLLYVGLSFVLTKLLSRSSNRVSLVVVCLESVGTTKDLSVQGQSLTSRGHPVRFLWKFFAPQKARVGKA